MTKVIVKPKLSTTDVGHHLDALRLAVGRADALANVTMLVFDERDRDDPLAEERVSHLIDATAEASAR